MGSLVIAVKGGVMSKQYDIIYSVVNNSHDHPTAEMVWGRAKELKKSINLATVYRNLSVLERENKIKRIHTPSGDRFDKTLYNHAHFKCDCCGVFFDVEGVNLEKMVDNLPKSIHNITSVEFTLSGTCAECKNKVKN